MQQQLPITRRTRWNTWTAKAHGFTVGSVSLYANVMTGEWYWFPRLSYGLTPWWERTELVTMKRIVRVYWGCCGLALAWGTNNDK